MLQTHIRGMSGWGAPITSRFEIIHGEVKKIAFFISFKLPSSGIEGICENDLYIFFPIVLKTQLDLPHGECRSF